MIQGDISPNDFMVNEEHKNSLWRSFIIETNLEIKEKREECSGARGKTGNESVHGNRIASGREAFIY